MAWLAENWLLVLLLGGMVAMHMFGHGHGGHGGHKKGGHNHGPTDARHDAQDDTPDTQTEPEPERETETEPETETETETETAAKDARFS